MFKPVAKTVVLFTLIILVSACGPTATDVPSTATSVPALPTTVPPPTMPTDVPPTEVPSTATPIPPTETATSVPTETATPLPTVTPTAPDDLKLDVPLGNPATIDGTLSPDEWSGARTVSLTDGELLLMHDGAYLYLGIRSGVPSLGSICVDRGDTVAVLHSSASLGTAIYAKSGEDWERTRDFAWTNSYGSHLRREGWLASDVNMGSGGEMEYQIAMPEGVMHLVVTVLKETDSTSPTVWPAHLADGCQEVRLLQGYAPVRMQLSPETWMTVIASTASAPAATQMGTIAFDGDDGINVMDVAAALDAGRDNRRLLIDDAFGAAWSPDGSQIAFASARDGGRMGIFVMAVPDGTDADGGEPRRVTDDTLGGIGPTWSPDGTQIAFVTDQGGQWDIYVISADGSEPRRLTFDSAIDGHPKWSPDGVHIAFMSERSGNPDIYLLNVAEGGEPVNLTQNAAVDAAPDWSPDGSQIVFYSNRGGGAENIYIMDSDGGNVTQWTNSRAGDWHPAWSPDGSRIAFVSFRSHQDGDAEIYVLDLAGGPESEGNRPQRLTYSPSHDENPVWRPAAKPTEVPSTMPAAGAECAGLIPEFTKAEVRRFVDKGLNAGIVVGIVAPCGREVYAYGQTTLSGGQAVDEDTVFEIGSIGKVFTTLLLADMVQRNEVSFDDPIEQFLPSGVAVPTYNGRSITLMDLATHSSGLPGIPDNLAPADELNPYADYTVEQMYEALAQIRLTRDIGARYEYSNLGMGLLGHILSLQSGMSYEALVVTRIADELGMPDTRVTLTPAMQSRLATGYREEEPFPLWDNPTLAGAGALRSTVHDMLTFLAANVGLQESRLYEAMQVTHESRYLVDASMRVGLAWHIRTEGDLQVVEHHGATGGYWSFAGFVEDRQTGVVVLTNTFHDIDEIGLGLLRYAATRPSAPAETPPLATESSTPSFVGMKNYGGIQDDVAWDGLLSEDGGYYCAGRDGGW